MRGTDWRADLSPLEAHENRLRGRATKLTDPGVLNDILEAFERRWQPTESLLLETAVEHGFLDCPEALAELVRVDIDRRYSASCPVDLPTYFDSFPCLAESVEAAGAIAFEDFRARQSRGLSVDLERWAWLPGIRQQNWFQEQQRRHSLELVSSGGGDMVRQSAGRGCDETLTTGTSSDSGEPAIGRRFGEFQLLALLGSGAFSRVFLALQTSLASRYVAVKVVRRTLDEPVHLARMQHTGIVPLYSFHRIGSYSVLCMPYAGSTTLADWLASTRQELCRDGKSLVDTIEASRRNLTLLGADSDEAGGVGIGQEGTAGAVPLGPEVPATQPLQALRSLGPRAFTLWFAQRLAAALAHAHQRGIVHGDLKPANILIRNDGEPALIDFNLSRSEAGAAPEVVGGTLPYMAPEQLQALLGRRTLIDPASDVYSFGMILYELIEGKLPYAPPRSAADSDLSAALELRRDSLPPLRSAAATAGLQAIVRKCLCHDPWQRYADASLLLQDVENEQLHLPLRHARESLWRSRLAKLPRRFPRLFSAATMALVSLVVITGLAAASLMWWRQSQRLAAQAAVVRFRDHVTRSLPELLDAPASRIDAVVSSLAAGIDEHFGDRRHVRATPFLDWLSTAEQAEVLGSLYDYALSSAVLAAEKSLCRENADHEPIWELVDVCQQIPELAQGSRLLENLRQRLEGAPAVASAPTRDRHSPAIRPIDDLLEARILLAMGDPQGALQRLHSVIPLGTHEVLFWLVTGEAELQVGQAESARLSFTLAIRAAPQSSTCLASRAKASFALGDWRAAVEDYTAAIQLHPRDAALFANRALVYERLGDYQAGVNDLDAALQLEPHSTRLLFIRSRLHRQLGQEGRADDDFQEALRRQPQSVDDWVSRALARASSDPQQAIEDLRRAERLQPNSVQVQQNIAYLQSEHLRQPEAALETLDKILRWQAHHEMARGGRCVLRARLGRVAEALSDIDYLTRSLEKPQPATVYQIACAHALLSPQRAASRQESLKFLARALQMGYGRSLLDTDPDLGPIRNTQEFRRLREITALQSD